MLKKLLIVIGIFTALVIIFGAIGVYYFLPGKEQVLRFMKDHPEKAAITLVRNGHTLANLNEDQVMPLASTMKTIIAIEYAEQAAAGFINPDTLIPVAELDKFYIANTDGGAHSAWARSVSEKVQNESISLREIAKGMIRFSSNANTEWLCMLLGLDKVNQRIDSLALKNHTKIYYLASSLFVGKERFPGLTGDELVSALEDMSTEEYISTTEQVHTLLLADTSYRRDLGDLSMKVQKIWSDRLPSSTTAEYVSLMQKINSKNYFSAKVHSYLDEVLEWPMEIPGNAEWLEYAGMKGGSTANVLTKTLYATDKDGNTVEMAYFFNGLNLMQNTKLQLSMNEFELGILRDGEFREKVRAELAE